MAALALVARRGRRQTAATALVVAAVLAGCTGIPTAGPVQEGDVPVGELGAPLSLAVDPVADGTPEEIVRGFLAAGAAGLSDEFEVARKFLTPRAEWNPRQQVLIHTVQGPQVHGRADGSVVVTVPVAAVVDEGGVYTEAVARAPHVMEFELAQDAADQWRISSAPDGVVMSPRDFEQLYREVSVYFASPDLTHLVPDLRHFPTANMPAMAVAALLDGPSSWLRDAVVSGDRVAADAPALNVSAVTIDGTVATVDLAAPASLAGADRNLLQVQLEATLLNLPIAITEVAVTVGGLPWVNNAGAELIVDPAPESGPYLLTDGALAVIEQGEILPLEDVPPMEGLGATRLALSPDGSLRVVRSGTSRVMLLPQDGGDPVELLAGAALIPPSVDRFGWVWSGPEVAAGRLVGVAADGTQTDIAADWLAGAAVRSARVARDGARVVVVSADENGRVSVDVAGVVRDESGRPLRLGERWQIGASLTDATDVSWLDEVDVAVLGVTGSGGSPMMHLVPVGGPTTPTSLIEGAIGIATGKGMRAQYVVDRDGQLWLRQGEVWAVVATEVTDVAFPG